MTRGSRTVRAIALGLPALVVVVLVAGSMFRGGIRMHQDEPAWIGSAYYFDLLARGEPDHPDWRLLPARESPFVGKFLFGVALRAAGHPVQSFDPLAAWHEAWRLPSGAGGGSLARAERLAVSRRLSADARLAIRRNRFRYVQPSQLVAARLVAASFGIACAVAVAALGLRCRGPATGLVAGIAFALHGLAIDGYTHAMFDVIALAFSALAMLALIALVGPAWGDPGGPRRTLAMGLITGVLLALAVGTKMNAMIVVLVAASLAVVVLARAARTGDRRGPGVARSLGLSLVVGLLAFITINPTLHGDLAGGLRDLFAMPARTTRVQASFLPDHLTTLGAKFRAVSTLVCGHPGGLIALTLVTLWPTWEGLRRFSPRSVLVLWWWTALGAVLAWIPFPWPRYALPLLPPAALLLGDALVGWAAGLRSLRGGPRA
jgi:hypothetical protein